MDMSIKGKRKLHDMRIAEWIMRVLCTERSNRTISWDILRNKNEVYHVNTKSKHHR